MFKVRYAVRSKDDDDTRMIAKSADVEVVPVIGTDFAFGGDRTSPRSRVRQITPPYGRRVYSLVELDPIKPELLSTLSLSGEWFLV